MYAFFLDIKFALINVFLGTMTVPSGIFKSETNEASNIVFGVGSVIGNNVVEATEETTVLLAIGAAAVVVVPLAVEDDVDDGVEVRVMISSGFEII